MDESLRMLERILATLLGGFFRRGTSRPCSGFLRVKEQASSIQMKTAKPSPVTGDGTREKRILASGRRNESATENPMDEDRRFQFPPDNFTYS
jgi:hypothetical protein